MEVKDADAEVVPNKNYSKARIIFQRPAKIEMFVFVIDGLV